MIAKRSAPPASSDSFTGLTLGVWRFGFGLEGDWVDGRSGGAGLGCAGETEVAGFGCGVAVGRTAEEAVGAAMALSPCGLTPAGGEGIAPGKGGFALPGLGGGNGADWLVLGVLLGFLPLERPNRLRIFESMGEGL